MGVSVHVGVKSLPPSSIRNKGWKQAAWVLLAVLRGMPLGKGFNLAGPGPPGGVSPQNHTDVIIVRSRLPFPNSTGSAERQHQSASAAIPVSPCTALPGCCFLNLPSSTSGLQGICLELIPWQEATCRATPSDVLKGLCSAGLRSLFVLKMLSSHSPRLAL